MVNTGTILVVSVVSITILVSIVVFLKRLFGRLPKDIRNDLKELDIMLDLLKGHKEQILNTERSLRNEITTQFSQLSNIQVGYLKTVGEQLSKVLTEVESKLERIRTENMEQLEKIRGVVDTKLDETLHKRLSQEFRSIQSLLAQVSEGVGQMQALSSEVIDLKRVLKGVKTRGIWGELQLERILQEFFVEGVHYEKNVRLSRGSQESVEFAIKIPTKANSDDFIYLPVDSKFPLEVFERMLLAYEKGEVEMLESHRKELARIIQSQAQRIKKYISPPHTTNFAVMYLPLESLYAEVLRIPGLGVKIQQQYSVLISGPSTFAAFVNSLQLGFRTLRIQEKTKEIWRLVGMIKTDFEKFSKLLENAITNLERTKRQLEEAVVRSRRLRDRVERVEGMNSQNQIDNSGVDTNSIVTKLNNS